MLDVPIAADTDFGERAILEVEQYVKKHAAPQYSGPEEWPIARSQISGLRQIAMREPEQLKDFAEHQRQKVAARLEATTKEERKQELLGEIAFWELIKNLCDGKPPKTHWSLAQAREQALPPELQEEKLPAGAQLTKEQQQARKEKQERRKQWLRQWNRDYYAAFFQRFCAHYLYLMARRTQEGGDRHGDCEDF